MGFRSVYDLRIAKPEINLCKDGEQIKLIRINEMVAKVVGRGLDRI